MQLKYHSMNTKNQINMMSLIVAYYGPSTTTRLWQSVLGRSNADLWAIHQRYSILPPHNLVTIWKNRVYGLSTNVAASGTYYRQNPHAICISQKKCLKTGITISYKLSRKTCHSTKLGLEISFIKF